MSEHPPCDPSVIAGKAHASRLLTGTGKYSDFEQTRAATQACKAVGDRRGAFPAGRIPRMRDAWASSPIAGLIA